MFGWDTVNNDYDMDETDGRSYISAVSEIVLDPNQLCEGNAKNTMGEARMVSYLVLCGIVLWCGLCRRATGRRLRVLYTAVGCFLFPAAMVARRARSFHTTDQPAA